MQWPTAPMLFPHLFTNQVWTNTQNDDHFVLPLAGVAKFKTKAIYSGKYFGISLQLHMGGWLSGCPELAGVKSKLKVKAAQKSLLSSQASCNFQWEPELQSAWEVDHISNKSARKDQSPVRRILCRFVWFCPQITFSMCRGPISLWWLRACHARKGE